ncbi:hypothetical protein TOT_010000556 [Theileria orientalis strain Shintoku]|uniref:Uncharacterized protein n=1 Tax=Theileria orientalis strain Shintoku TaxID=869250 RepID=J4DNK0_THEOR|nr:hypothetical protein TOT_010000556 [Theileria orientalis strain Shintoku]BAM39094.1 hypothetical protein TOT_010000556 [Theileria orientalis strain Shintoku]|eukprot:XP_009689395.1 hypothetical protein TOT_010000556 [Theileria orientalis strain Shintoku]
MKAVAQIQTVFVMSLKSKTRKRDSKKRASKAGKIVCKDEQGKSNPGLLGGKEGGISPRQPATAQCPEDGSYQRIELQALLRSLRSQSSTGLGVDLDINTAATKDNFRSQLALMQRYLRQDTGLLFKLQIKEFYQASETHKVVTKA